MLPIAASKKIILTVNFKRCLIFTSLFEASAVGVPSLHRFRFSSVHVCGHCVDDVAFVVLSDVLFASHLSSAIRSPMNVSRRSPEEFRWKILCQNRNKND